MTPADRGAAGDEPAADPLAARAEEAEERGQFREAARLYDELAQRRRAEYGPYDPRTLDAFEALARVIAGD
ncbi:hypothetical protein AB0K51_19195 [Kitasatospora sp. NPDC049285]|uniref:hypothetical protein n=1 Tax=Kitasatospora sp. NPDC049285 TaxID=3157096 RepID=UPI00341B0CEC